MKAKARGPETKTGTLSSRRTAYQEVRDSDKRAIRGLWRRRDRFYARLAVFNAAAGQPEVRRVPLLDPETKQPVTTVPAAKRAMERLKVQRDTNALPVITRTPTFGEFVAQYVASLRKVADLKPSTIDKKAGELDLWVEHMGADTRLDRITKKHILTFREKRADAGISARTCNLDAIALRTCLKRAVEEDLIRDLPMHGLRPLKTATC